MPHIVVTGGNGYVGAALVRAALAQGWHVTSLERRPGPTREQRLHRVAWRLGEALPDAVTRQDPPIDAVIHAAHEWNTEGGENDPNLIGTTDLLRSAQAAKIARFIFVSSVSARQDALNAYGRLKWTIEQIVEPLGGISVRVGLVYGGPRRAQYGTLAKLAGFGILPMVSPRKLVQPIYLDELCDGLLALASAPTLARPVYVLAAPAAITFSEFLKTLARELHQQPLFVVLIPVRLALFVCDFSARMPWLPRVNRERVLGLEGMQVLDGGDGLAEIGLHIQPMAQNLAREPVIWISHLIREGQVLLHYVLGMRPPALLSRRYARALSATSDNTPLNLPALARRCPWLLRYAEPFPRRPNAFGRRLDIATRLAETCSVGTDRFFAYRNARIPTLFSVAVQILADLLALPFRLMQR